MIPLDTCDVIGIGESPRRSERLLRRTDQSSVRGIGSGLGKTWCRRRGAHMAIKDVARRRTKVGETVWKDELESNYTVDCSLKYVGKDVVEDGRTSGRDQEGDAVVPEISSADSNSCTRVSTDNENAVKPAAVGRDENHPRLHREHHLQHLQQTPHQLQRQQVSHSTSDTTSTAVHPSSIPLPEDPREWSRDDVHHWLRLVRSSFGIVEEIHADRFMMNGKALCLMRPDMFSFRVPSAGFLLYNDFRNRLGRAIAKNNNYSAEFNEL